jgi:hypothetical protein
LYVKGKETSKKRFQVSFTEEEKRRSSTYRELRGMEDGLTILGPDLKRKRVQWGCDNWAACRAVELGSTKVDCMEIAQRITQVVEKFDIDLQVVWKRRSTEEITLCDKLSKDFDLAEYRLSMECFSKLEVKYGPFCMDYFASDWSHRMTPFVSRYLTTGAKFKDAFSVDWSQGKGYFHPPVGDIARVLEKARQEGAQGILLVPDWPGSEVIGIVERESRKVKLEEMISVKFECPDWMESNTFRGRAGFYMRIYRMCN